MSMEEENARHGAPDSGAAVSGQSLPAQPSAEDEELAAALALSMGVQDDGDVDMTADEEMARAMEMSMQVEEESSGKVGIGSHSGFGPFLS